jgi:hypothetical protein
MSVYYRDARVTIHHGDCRDVLRDMDRSTADGCVLDPPFTEWGTLGAVLGECARVAPSGYWLAFTRMPLTLDLWRDVDEAKAVGAPIAFYEHLVWTDTQPRYVSQHRPLRTHEEIMVLKVGATSQKPNMQVGDLITDRTSRAKGASSIGKWTKADRVYRPKERKYLTSHLAYNRNLRDPLGVWQKPEALITVLLNAFCAEAETILDPFCGSGTTLVAAASLGKRTIGIEHHEAYCEIAARRCEQAQVTA